MKIKRNYKVNTVIIFLFIVGCVYIGIQCQLNPGCRYSIQGIDVSRYQEDIDWDVVEKNSIAFAFVKATEGRSLVDTYLDENWKRLDEKNIKRGAYHFYRPAVRAEVQANHFIKNVKLKKGDLPPVLDLEETDNRSKKIILKGVKIWLDKIEKHYKVKPIIYVNRSYYKDYIKGNFDDYVIWIAAYTWKTPKLGKKKWRFWQYSDEGKINGIEGNVDLNVFNGSLMDLENLLKK